MSKKELGLDGQAQLVLKLAKDFVQYINSERPLPELYQYKIVVRQEEHAIDRTARMAAFNKLVQPIKKIAFDTRRINQETDRIPRSNLQYWHRSDEFISQPEQEKINIFAKLMISLEDLKEKYGTQKEWHNSYSRVLYDTVSKTLRVKQGDQDIFAPQLAYLEQLIFARYRLSLDDLTKLGHDEIKQKILSKDEDLMKRGVFLPTPRIVKENQMSNEGKNAARQEPQIAPVQMPPIIISGGNKSGQDQLLDTLFGGNNSLRKDGERTVERTITITIRDAAID